MKKQLIFLTLLLCSCTEIGENKPPKNLLPPEQMTDIMTDIILMKNIQRNGYMVEGGEQFLVGQYLYDKYEIDSLQLASSLDYYAQNPKKYLPIFNSVLAKVQKLRDSVQELELTDEDR